MGGDKGKKPNPPSNSKDPGDAGEAAGDDGSVDVKEVNQGIQSIDSYQAVNANAFVVKNNLQLRAAADACLGAGLGVITDDMFAAGRCQGGARQQAPAQADSEKLVILGADKCGYRSQHIYEVLKDQLWSPDLAGRTDTLANELTPSYLQALAVAADVYAHGVSQPGALCDTPEKAKELVGKCLAQYPEAEIDKAATAIAGLCSQGAVKAREALATILGSVAFAAATTRDGGE
jgi:hypothetical protein